MKRSIRRRCGYGCVICGKPIYQYHHVLGFDPETGHVEGEITLLCPYHHEQADGSAKALIPVGEIQKYDSEPHNVRAGRSPADRVWWSSGDPTIRMADVLVRADASGRSFAAVTIDSLDVISFRVEEGNVLLNLRLKDLSGAEVLTIEDNELSYSVLPFEDIEFVGTTLTIRGPHGQLNQYAFSKDSSTFEVRNGAFTSNGAIVMIKDGLLILKNRNGTQWAFGAEGGGSLAMVAPVGIRCGRRAPWDARPQVLWQINPPRVIRTGENLYRNASEEEFPMEQRAEDVGRFDRDQTSYDFPY